MIASQDLTDHGPACPPSGARFMMEEHVLPDLHRSGLMDHFIDVQAQYAVKNVGVKDLTRTLA